MVYSYIQNILWPIFVSTAHARSNDCSSNFNNSTRNIIYASSFWTRQLAQEMTNIMYSNCFKCSKLRFSFLNVLPKITVCSLKPSAMSLGLVNFFSLTFNSFTFVCLLCLPSKPFIVFHAVFGFLFSLVILLE